MRVIFMLVSRRCTAASIAREWAATALTHSASSESRSARWPRQLSVASSRASVVSRRSCIGSLVLIGASSLTFGRPPPAALTRRWRPFIGRLAVRPYVAGAAGTPVEQSSVGPCLAASARIASLRMPGVVRMAASHRRRSSSPGPRRLSARRGLRGAVITGRQYRGGGHRDGISDHQPCIGGGPGGVDEQRGERLEPPIRCQNDPPRRHVQPAIPRRRGSPPAARPNCGCSSEVSRERHSSLSAADPGRTRSAGGVPRGVIRLVPKRPLRSFPASVDRSPELRRGMMEPVWDYQPAG